ncbi:ATP-binding protein [Caenimonas terrae]|uniref:histidine kinase n=1 Tax=Caenimonas terrae TaxID=696074 RepID=A0ABW0NEX3_9BURK
MNAPSAPGPSHASQRDWLEVALLLAAATGAGFALDRYVSATSQAMLYMLAVVIAAYRLPWLPSIVGATGAVTAFDFFFVPPRFTFEVESREHLIALGTMLAVAVVISHLARALRWQTATAQLNERRARQLQGLATELAAAAGPGEILSAAQRALDAAFPGPCVVAAVNTDGRLDLPSSAAALRDGMLCCMREAAVLGPGTGRWPGLDAWYLPLGDKAAMNGVACIQNIAAADDSGREHAQALCSLISQALLRAKLTQSMQAAREEAQRQHLQSTLLAAISHDLRTPLAAVVGAASALQTQRDKLAPAEQERLLASIVSEAGYLSTVTENTLQLVRLGNAGELRRDWESIEEIVGAVLARVRQRDPARRIRSSVPAGLPLLRADPVLLAQLLENLLDNALKYSDDAIDLVVALAGDRLQVCVKDRGPGIAAEDEALIFEPYRRNDSSGQRGAGLGLALCRAIAQAHGGTLCLRRRDGGGSSFRLSLPVDPRQPQRSLA